MAARPAGSVRVVDVDMQLRIAVQQFADLDERREIDEHRVEAIDDQPDGVVALRELSDIASICETSLCDTPWTGTPCKISTAMCRLACAN